MSVSLRSSADDAFYVKVDDVSREEFEAAGLKPFRFESRGKRVVMDYYAPPVEVLDNRELLCAWGRKGLEAAGRAGRGRSSA